MAKPATKTTGKDVAPVDTQTKAVASAGALPSFMQGFQGQGVENIDNSDMETPRIVLLQASSPQVLEFDDAKPGQFWHSMAERSLGNSFEAVISFVDKRALLWRPRPPEDTGGILARSEDCINWSVPNASFEVNLKGSRKKVKWHTKANVAASRLLEWGSSDPEDPNSQPAATLMYNFVLNLPEHEDLPPAVLTMQRSTAKAARKLLGRLKMAAAPTFGLRFTFESFLDEANSQKFYNIRVVSIGMVESEGDFLRYQEVYEALKRSGLKMAEVQEEAEASQGDDDEGKTKRKF